MNEEQQKEILFNKGLELFNQGNYYDAHEEWETLWSDYYLPDRDFVQGLIQLSVSFVHLSNGNLIGAKSLLKKSQRKMNNFQGICRGLNVDSLKDELFQLSHEYETLESNTTFNWNLVPTLRK